MILANSDTYYKDAERKVNKAVEVGLRIAVVVPCYNVEEHIAEAAA